MNNNYVWEELACSSEVSLKGAYHNHPRTELVTLFKHPPRRVLDIGCAAGATGQLIKTLYPGAYVMGIECNRAAAEIATEKIDRVLVGRIEEFDLHQSGISTGEIDTVILGDVLEHLYNPWGVLRDLRPFLSEDAQILASIPNARNLWLLNELAHGRWSYSEEGLLDVTHIRFFTLSEIYKLFQETGYEILGLEDNPDTRFDTLCISHQRSDIVSTDKLTFENVGDRERKELRTLQFLVLARPRPQACEGASHVGSSLESSVAYPKMQEHYNQWLASHAYQERDAIWLAERMAQWSHTPRFHLAVLLSRDAEEQLAETINALADQFYDRWHLSIVAETPAPAEVAGLEVLTWIQAKDGLATLNEALCMQEADWVGVIHAGDRVAPHALFAFVETTNRQPGWQLIYSDEDSWQDGMRQAPRFKPDFNPDLLRSMDYIGDLMLMRRDLFHDLGGFDPVMAEAARYDLMLRAYERLGVDGIGHIPDVLYHRVTQAPASPEMACQALQTHLYRRGEDANVESGLLPNTRRVRYALQGQPWVTIIIPTRDRRDLLEPCIEGVLHRSSYPHFDILIVDNDSKDPATLEYLDALRAHYPERVSVLAYPHPFNYAAQMNLAARQARGEFLVLLNNDTELTQSDWIEVMLGQAQRDEIGGVGVRLLFPDGALQHAGVVLGMGVFGVADHPGHGQPASNRGYLGRFQVEQNYSAVTAACLMVDKKKYFQVEGLDEDNLHINYNDVDFCLKLQDAGYRNVWTPFVSMVHKGSASRHTDVDKPVEHPRFWHEVDTMLSRWGKRLSYDPAFNRNLSLMEVSFSIEQETGLTWDPDWRPRPRVLALAADRMGCGEQRVWGPMRALNHAGAIQGWSSGFLFTPTEVGRMDPESIVFQRQIEWRQIEAIQRHKKFNRALRIFELDDLMTQVPFENANHAAIPKDISERLRVAAGLCDRLVVSTEPLAHAYGSWAPELRVVPNFIERARWADLAPPRQVRKKPRVGWAGGAGHEGDLSVIEEVVRLLADEVDWVFFGMCPDSWRSNVREFHPLVPIEAYPARLAALDLDLAVAPLELNAFNEAKSHLRILEYGILGYPVVCTDIYPYQSAPVTRVRNRTQEWVDAIRMHLADPVASAAAGERLRTYVMQNWILEENLDKWVEAWLP